MACLRYFSFELHLPAKRTGVGAHNSTRPKHKYSKRWRYFSTADLHLKVMNTMVNANNLQELITNYHYHNHIHQHHYLNNNNGRNNYHNNNNNKRSNNSHGTDFLIWGAHIRLIKPPHNRRKQVLEKKGE